MSRMSYYCHFNRHGVKLVLNELWFFDRSVMRGRTGGAVFGISDVRGPTMTMQGHRALFAGLLEDPSSIFDLWKVYRTPFDSVFHSVPSSLLIAFPAIIQMFAPGMSHVPNQNIPKAQYQLLHHNTPLYVVQIQYHYHYCACLRVELFLSCFTGMRVDLRFHDTNGEISFSLGQVKLAKLPHNQIVK
jgi:hypothetical protein